MGLSEAPARPLDQVTVSDAACEVLCRIAESNPDLWVLTGDVWTTARLQPFATKFPARFMNVGIAEQSMVGVAAGLATCGKLPVVAAFASMLSMRACEQIRSDVGYNNLNVKFLSSAAGFSAGHAGPTHHGTEDLAMIRAIGNMTVIAPCDANETRQAVEAALAHTGPVYIRLGGRANDYTVYADAPEFQIGKANVIRDGDDVTIIGCGRVVTECLLAAEILAADGVQARVIDMHTVKPIDVDAITQAARSTRMIFTVEDHNFIGGLGGAVAEALAGLGTATPLQRIGVADGYAPVGSQEALLKHYGLTAAQVAATVKDRLQGTPRPSRRRSR